MTGAIVCFTTTNGMKEAKKLATTLVAEKLAACVQVVPKITSFYEWDGAIQEEQEFLLIIKSAADRLEDIKSFIREHHSYEVPELVAVNVADGLPAYLEWLASVTA